MHRVCSGGDAHVCSRSAPCNWAHIGVCQAVCIEGCTFGGLDLRNGIRDFKVEVFCGGVQPFRVLFAEENLAFVAPLALEYRGGVVHCMRQDVHIGVAPVDKFAVHPYFSIAVIICSSHCSPLFEFAFITY